jgi:serine/threonine-protein kinase
MVIGGVGVVGVGVGSYFGVKAISKNSDAETLCSADNLCPPQGMTLTDEARKAATASNIAFAAGGALVAIGVVVFVTGGRSDTERLALVPLLAPGTAAASIWGRF